MNIKKNSFRKLFPATRPQYGVWNGLVDNIVAEILAGSGYDWILVDGEHAPFDLQSIQSQIQALGQFGIPVLVRPAKGDSVVIKQLMDVGVQTLVVPMVETAEQAEYVFKSMRYPPQGIRGVGTAMARASQWNRVNNYFQNANDEMCLIVQVESVKGIENLDVILAVEGIEGVFIGPADLAASMGYLGKGDHPEVVKVIEVAIQKIKAANKINGIMVIGNKSLTESYASLGSNMIAVAIDTLLLAKSAMEVANSFIGENIDNQSNTKY